METLSTTIGFSFRWSPSTIALYEVGEIPTVGSNRLLNVLIKNPQVMKDFIEEKKNSENLEL